MNYLTLIIPAKNESESLPHIIDSLNYLKCKIKVSLKIDDVATINSIKNKDVEIFYQSGIGYGNSLREAINSCQTKYFCIFNADGSFNHKDLLKMYQLMTANDFIFTTRYENGGGSEDDTIVTYIGNKFFSKLGNILFSLKISDILYTYLIGKTSSFNSLNIKSNNFTFCVELPIKMELQQMRYKCLPSFEKKRIAGKKKVNAFIDGFLILLEMIKLFVNFKIFRNKVID